MNVVAYGAGTNSTAMLIELVNRQIPVDLIIFADTGGERPHTLQYVKTFSKWLNVMGCPEIVTVKKVRRNGDVLTLEQDCLEKNMLPSIAYGFKSCSQKYKLQPVDKYLNNWQPARDEWAAGRKITRFVGFDADEQHRIKDYSDDKYNVEFPLVDWDIGRDECIDIIAETSLCLPGKSACFFCPSSKPAEIKQLKANYPELSERALTLEANSEAHTVLGLGRNWAWKDVLATDDMFEDEFAYAPEMVCGCYDG